MERDTGANTQYPWKSSCVFGDTPHAPQPSNPFLLLISPAG